ncbi:MAG: nicotinamidase, partial [Myxococcota bacterium]
MSTPHHPSFFDPDRCSQLYLPRYGAVAAAAQAHQGAVKPASKDTERIAVFGIDCQVGFSTPGASLFVPGAVEDMQRGSQFILNHLERITTLIFSLDTHRAYQIFHPAFWTNAEGNAPAPMTVITADDVRSGRWLPLRDVRKVVAYCELLEATERYVLTIWPYHTLLGSPDHALVPALFEVAHYHSIVRQTQTHFITKGEHPMTENYSVFEPEVKEIDGE